MGWSQGAYGMMTKAAIGYGAAAPGAAWSAIKNSSGTTRATIAGGVLGGYSQDDGFMMGAIGGAGAGRYGYSMARGAGKAISMNARLGRAMKRSPGFYHDEPSSFKRVGRMVANGAINQFASDYKSASALASRAGGFIGNTSDRAYNGIRGLRR